MCHVQTINWEEILTGPNARYFYVYNFTTPERECSQCDPSCTYGCWGEGPDNCQKFSKINCSPQCYQGRCFGKKPRECCHLFCAGGCTGPKQTDCLVGFEVLFVFFYFLLRSFSRCRFFVLRNYVYPWLFSLVANRSIDQAKRFFIRILYNDNLL